MSTASRVLAVNFHFIRPSDDARYPGLHARTPAQFSDQIDELERLADPIDPGDFQRLIDGDRSVRVPKKGFLLTFDDGLKDHISYVAPELAKRGIHAFFFVGTAPWAGELLRVHRMQLLLGSTQESELCDFFDSAMEARGLAAEIGVISSEMVRSVYKYDTEPTARLKYAINFMLPDEMAGSLVHELFDEFLGDEEDHIDNLYMSEDEVLQLHLSGHIVGAHTHHHRPLAQMSRRERTVDITANLEALHHAIGEIPKWISFPHGVAASINADVLATCREFGLRYGFTMNRGLVHAGDDPLYLNRVDTNDAPGGKMPSMSWDDD